MSNEKCHLITFTIQCIFPVPELTQYRNLRFILMRVPQFSGIVCLAGCPASHFSSPLWPDLPLFSPGIEYMSSLVALSCPLPPCLPPPKRGPGPPGERPENVREESTVRCEKEVG